MKILLPFLTLPLLAATPQDVARTEPAEVLEDIEVMRRLIERDLRGTASSFEGTMLDLGKGAEVYDEASHLLSVTEYLTTRVTHSRGYHVPGSGVVMTFDLQVPVVAAPAEVSQVDGAEVKDEWDRVRNEVRGGDPAPAQDGSGNQAVSEAVKGLGLDLRYGVSARLPLLQLDRQAIEASIDTIQTTLAKHGSRIRGITGEAVTICVYAHPNAAYSSAGVTGETPSHVSMLTGSLVLRNRMGSGVEPQRFIVQANAADLTRHKDHVSQAKAAMRVARY